MHDSHKIRTLLACIDDLTKAVHEMSAESSIHQADQDLLLYRSRLFYEAVLCMPTAEAVAPTAPAPAMQENVEEVAVATPSLSSAISEAIEQSIEAAVEQAITQNEEVEVDLTFEAAAPVVEELPAVEEAEVFSQTAAAKDEAAIEAEEVVETAAPAEVAAESAAAPTQEVAVEKTQSEPAVPAEPAPAAKPAAKSVAFSLTGIIERSGDSHLVMAHLKLKPIDDLKSGIGLNEKFLFIRELFGNDHLAYADAIEKLNAAPSLNAAEQILASEVLPQQQWDLETEAALSFLHLIFRRFAQS
ncbi:MAG: hypothetical protein Q8J69_00265 [Sphingobacteriaceae bacterium]|nr:hypothetical protein [Sphingobacteriaceae bacterium]